MTMESVFITVAALFALICLLEFAVLLFWYSPYYRTGITVFRRRYTAPDELDLDPRALGSASHPVVLRPSCSVNSRATKSLSAND
jgi:hypothetical protein